MTQILDKRKSIFAIFESMSSPSFIHREDTMREKTTKNLSNDIIPSFVFCSVVDILKKIILWKTYV